MPDDERNASEIRLECLRLAHQNGGGDETVVSRARAYADFVVGARDAEIIDAARRFTEAVSRQA